MAKGAGMIHPHLATMLAVVTTDYPLEPGEASRSSARGRPQLQPDLGRRRVLDERRRRAARERRAKIERTPATDLAFAAALREVCAELAQQIVADGEGATMLLEIEVAGAATDGEAEAIARRIATSPLVKTAAFGRDANWGRVLMAAGSAPFNGGFARSTSSRISLAFNGTEVFHAGAPSASSRPSTAPSARSRSTSASARATPRTSPPT